MARILGEDGHVYQSLDLGTFTEPEIQRQIRAKSRTVFPGFTFILCAPSIESDFDVRKPDFILIEDRYRSWWIGEVEKSGHSLDSHVIPQIETFIAGHFDETHANAVLREADHLNRDSLNMLIANERPNVLVVVDRIKPDWSTRLEARGAKLAIFEIFRSDTHRYLFRVNGFCPSPPPEFQSECQVLASMPMLLRVFSPAGFNLQPKQAVSVRFRGDFSSWSVIVSEGNMFLRPAHGHSLSLDRKYRLTRSADGTLEIGELGK